MACYLCVYGKKEQPYRTDNPRIQTNEDVGVCSMCWVLACPTHGSRYSAFECALCRTARAVAAAAKGDPDEIEAELQSLASLEILNVEARQHEASVDAAKMARAIRTVQVVVGSDDVQAAGTHLAESGQDPDAVRTGALIANDARRFQMEPGGDVSPEATALAVKAFCIGRALQPEVGLRDGRIANQSGALSVLQLAYDTAEVLGTCRTRGS